MEEFGDWIYLLVIIIAGVTSLISSTRKKARQAAEQPQPRQVITTQNDEDDVWDDYIPKAEKKPVVPIQPKQPARRPDPFVTKQNTQYYTFDQEGQPALPMEESKLLEIDDDLAVFTVEDLPENVDDWRKAFIYNEIFSRRN